MWNPIAFVTPSFGGAVRKVTFLGGALWLVAVLSVLFGVGFAPDFAACDADEDVSQVELLR